MRMMVIAMCFIVDWNSEHELIDPLRWVSNNETNDVRKLVDLTSSSESADGHFGSCDLADRTLC